MFNKVVLENPIRKKLKTAALIVVLFLVFTVVMTVLFASLNKKDYNGQTIKIDGVAETLVSNGDIVLLKLKNNDELFNISAIKKQVDLEELPNKSVTIWVPQSQLGGDYRFVHGLAVDGNIVVDVQDHTSAVRKENQQIITVFATISAVLATATCAIIIWNINTTRIKEFPLAPKYVEFYMQKQPLCPQRKTVTIVLVAHSLLLIVLLLICIIANGVKEQSDAFNFAMLGIIAAATISCFVSNLLLSKWALKKEIDFYDEKFPFDFTDISHVPLKKEMKQQIQQQLKLEQQRHPDDYGDGGNGFWVHFDEQGAQLFAPKFNETPDGLEEDLTAPLLNLTYEQLNFEAVPIFRKQRPLFVVVKSQLKPDADFPNELVNDLHFILDINLLATLQKFNVSVENLQSVLQNKKQLMTENCLK